MTYKEDNRVNKIEKRILAKVQTMMNLEEEKAKFDKLQGQNPERKFDFDVWIKTWGYTDVKVIMAYSIKYGISTDRFADQWIAMDEKEKMEIYILVRDLIK